jgi:glycolate oxidase iron-sulfur subunit
MRAIVDQRMAVSSAFGEEMYFCLGCLACETACPAGVEYSHLFEVARATAEESGVLRRPSRELVRSLSLRVLFTRPWLLRFVARLFWFYQRTGAQALVRKLRLPKLIPRYYQKLEAQTPRVCRQFSDSLISEVEPAINRQRYRVGLLTGCVQDVLFSNINRDTATVLRQFGCEVVTPRGQSCCGSLHAHNGDLETARNLARRNLRAFDLSSLDAVITNAAGCGSHLKHYDRLLSDDPTYAAQAAEWSHKLKDISEWLVEIGSVSSPAKSMPITVTYHEACHLYHGQKISQQPRQLLRNIPGLKLVELTEATWCCGSAGIYNLTQPDMAQRLLDRKLDHIARTNAKIVVTANPGCHLQIQNGIRQRGLNMKVKHPVSLLREAFDDRAETPLQQLQ